METIEPIFIAYVSLQVMAIIPIFFGSHLAVEEGQKEEAEQVSANDAYLFPAIGSVCLFSFYLVFKFFPKEYVNYLLTAYFGIFGTVAMVQVLVRFAQCFLPKPLEMAGHIHMRAETAKKETIFDFNITWLNVLVSLGSSLFTAYYVWSKNWIASNVFGEAFAISAISMIHLDTFKTGMILLAGLFVYDVFWVFGTDVMVTVAKSFDVPVKLLFPKDVLADATANFTMLGLGDIVIPGAYIALCLKFDKHLGSSINKYFISGLVFYILGLITTMYVMHTFKAAQPALLYLSPACIISSLLVAAVSGELTQLFSFTTEKEPSNSTTKKNSKSKTTPHKKSE